MTVQPAEASDGPTSGSRAWALFGGVIAVAAFANAAAYIAYAGNPLVSSDAWYFIGAFLQQAMESGADVQAFFVKRGAFDHAQPLHKLLLLLNARWFGLDFVFEALAGLAFALAMFLACVRASRDVAELQPASFRALSIGALAASLVTLCCGMVFDWSLVTLMYLPYLLVTLGAIAAWRFITRGAYTWLPIAAFCIAFAFDDVGIILNAALAATCVLAAARLRRWRAGAGAIAVIAAAELLYLLFSHVLLQQPAVSADVPPPVEWPELWPQLPVIARIVLGSTIAHINPLTSYFGETAAGIQAVLAIMVALAHAWFWWRALRGTWSAPVCIGVALMLVLYGCVAGIIYARIMTYGIGYLNEPRYMVFYLLSNVALVCMLMGQSPARGGKTMHSLAYAALWALLLLQVPLSRYTWHEGRYLSAYYHKMAWQMLVLEAGTVPESCVPLLTVCSMPAMERAQAIQFLKVHQLNVFSPEFAERYRIQALVQAAQPARASNLTK